MGGVQLDAGEARGGGAAGGGDEVVVDARELGGGGRARALEVRLRLVEGAGADRLLAGEGGGAAHAAVVELDQAERAVAGERGGEALQAGELMITPDAELTGETLAVLRDVGGAGLDDGEAAGGAALEPAVLVAADRAVGVALLVGERGEGEAVAGGGAAAEGDRRGERGHAGRGCHGRGAG